MEKFNQLQAFNKPVNDNDSVIELFSVIGYNIESNQTNQWNLEGLTVTSRLTENGCRLIFEYIFEAGLFENRPTIISFFVIWGEWRKNILKSLQQRIAKFFAQYKKMVEKISLSLRIDKIIKPINALIPDCIAKNCKNHISIEYVGWKYKITGIKSQINILSFEVPPFTIRDNIDKFEFETKLNQIYEYAFLLSELLKVNNIIQTNFKI